MDSDPLATELREQGRGVVGALLVVGVSALYTVETWVAGWTLSSLHLLAYAVVGLAVVLAITWNVGFRDEAGGEGGIDEAGTDEGTTDEGVAEEGGGEEGKPESGRGQGSEIADESGGPERWFEAVTDFFEILVQSFVAAYVYFLLFGIIELTESPIVVARLGLVAVVPLGFGAALANEILTGDRRRDAPASFRKNLAVAALGAVFVAAPIAATEEVLRLASNAGWARLAVVVVATLVVTDLTLHELEFVGQAQRVRGIGEASQWSQTAIVYALGCAVSLGLLAMFGRVEGQGLAVWIQAVVVLGFPASIGGSAGRVVLG